MGKRLTILAETPCLNILSEVLPPFLFTLEMTTASDTSLAFCVQLTIFVVHPVKICFCIFTFSIACLRLNIISPVSSVTLVELECDVEHF